MADTSSLDTSNKKLSIDKQRETFFNMIAGSDSESDDSDEVLVHDAKEVNFSSTFKCINTLTISYQTSQIVPN